jgi:hypothetical protein
MRSTDEAAVAFYKLHGFRPFISQPMVLFLPLGAARKAAALCAPRRAPAARRALLEMEVSDDDSSPLRPDERSARIGEERCAVQPKRSAAR